METFDPSVHMKSVDQMTKLDYQTLLAKNVVVVTFVKKGSNEVRVLQGTLHPEVLQKVVPPGDGPAVDRPKRQAPPNQVACWDLEAGGWRSFNMETVTGYDLIPIAKVVTAGAG